MIFGKRLFLQPVGCYPLALIENSKIWVIWNDPRYVSTIFHRFFSILLICRAFTSLENLTILGKRLFLQPVCCYPLALIENSKIWVIWNDPRYVSSKCHRFFSILFICRAFTSLENLEKKIFIPSSLISKTTGWTRLYKVFQLLLPGGQAGLFKKWTVQISALFCLQPALGRQISYCTDPLYQ